MKEKPFEIKVGKQDLSMTAENLMVLLFRKEIYQDIDYFQYYVEEEGESLTIMRNPDLSRWMAGICFTASGIKIPKNKNRKTFNDEYGWSPRTIIRDVPDQSEIDDWVELSMLDIGDDGTFEMDE